MYVKFYMSETHACGHIRGEIPARAINANWNNVRVDCKTDILCSDFFKTSLMVFQRAHQPDLFSKMMAAKSMGIKTVYEIDDDMLNMPQEFDKPFEFYKKPEVRETMLKFMQNCDALTVSTIPLGESVRKMTPRPTFVVGNAIDLERWREAQLLRETRVLNKREDDVVIGFLASGSHLIDLPLIDKALCDIMKEYPRVKLFFVGTLSAEHLVKYELKHFLSRITFTNWVEINQLPGVIGSFDIGLAPLVDCPFNRCKSPLKWMQYCALGIPGVYSDLPLYRGTCSDGVDGFLAAPGKWREPLETLVKDADLRKRISVSALQNVQKWDINKTAGNWVRVWRQIMTIWM